MPLFSEDVEEVVSRSEDSNVAHKGEERFGEVDGFDEGKQHQAQQQGVGQSDGVVEKAGLRRSATEDVFACEEVEVAAEVEQGEGQEFRATGVIGLEAGGDDGDEGIGQQYPEQG